MLLFERTARDFNVTDFLAGDLMHDIVIPLTFYANGRELPASVFERR